MRCRVAALVLSCLLVPLAQPARGADSKQKYLGEHQLGVNRVSEKRRAGSVLVSQGERGLLLAGSARDGEFYLDLSGAIRRIDDRVLELEGELRGVPDMRWAQQPPRLRTTSGRFTFRVTKGRKFWRLYEVNGTDCVCDDGCGNDFCYVDIDLRVEAAPKR